MADFQAQSDAPANGGTACENPAQALSLGSKRHRRPSVRLGEIGEPSAAVATSYEAYYRKNRQWKVSRHGHLPPKELMLGKAAAAAAATSSKTRPLTNIGNGDAHETHELIDERNASGGDLEIGSRKGREPKQKRGGSMAAGTKRVRTNWVLRAEGGGEGEHEKLSGGNGDAAADDEGFRDFDPEGSETPSKEHSPIRSYDRGHGSEKEGGLPIPRRGFRTRVFESREPDAVELDVPSDMDGGDWRCGASLEQNGGRERRLRMHDDGVRSWLNELGLARYAQVFEIHEVDEEVLPLLTMEDLKDMGINAVGSRRKMYCSIQKLRKGFS